MAARSYIKSRFDAAIALAAALLFGAGINPVLVLLAAGSAGLFLRAGVQASEAANRQRPFRALQALALLGVVGAGWVFLSRMDQRLAELGLLMLRIDLFAFGGGYTSVPFMFHEVVEVRRWLSGPELLDGIALGQLTPGPIVITATFVGYLLQGLAGACVATIHVFLPSFFIVALLAPLVDRLRTRRWFNSVLRGILCCFVGLLVSSTLHFGLHLGWTWGLALFCAAGFGALLAGSPLLAVIAAGTAISVLFY